MKQMTQKPTTASFWVLEPCKIAIGRVEAKTLESTCPRISAPNILANTETPMIEPNTLNHCTKFANRSDWDNN